MVKYADRVAETTGTSGTGALSLGGAAVGGRTFAEGFTSGDEVTYTVENAARTQWETGTGTYTTGSISRDTVSASSNGGALVDFGSGAKTVFATAGAALLNPVQALVSGVGILWADRPTAAAAGNGALQWFSDIGGGSLWRSDGTNWRPANGRTRLYAKNGLIAAPLATLTGVTSGVFTLPETLTIPAGLIAPHSAVWGNFEIFRTGATATALVQWRIGTAGTTSDSIVYQSSMSATTNHQSRSYSAAKFGTGTDRFFAPNSSNMNGGGSQAAGVDRTTNVNTAAAMYATVDLSSANAADTFSLIAYSLWIEG